MLAVLSSGRFYGLKLSRLASYITFISSWFLVEYQRRQDVTSPSSAVREDKCGVCRLHFQNLTSPFALYLDCTGGVTLASPSSNSRFQRCHVWPTWFSRAINFEEKWESRKLIKLYRNRQKREKFSATFIWFLSFFEKFERNHDRKIFVISDECEEYRCYS